MVLALNASGENFRAGVVLVKRKGSAVEKLRVARGGELRQVLRLRQEENVQFAEVDRVLRRQFVPNDPKLKDQWHHAKVGSTNAWSIALGYGATRSPLVQLAIVDTPFQMSHPDLQANSSLGWSILANAPNPFETNGYFHSTIAAGLAGAVINNFTGVSGMVNCLLTPIDVGDGPTVSDMYEAITWAADHGIRVVNLSWDGADSAVINDAGAYLKEKARGMLFMAGENGEGRLNYPALPHIYAVAMTDRDDRARSTFGEHIDFAAPGWEIFSTSESSTYEIGSGTSYSAPMVAGIAAWIMSAAPELGPDEIEEILISGCVDLGDPGWDEHYGWGRIDFARVAEETFRRTAISRVELVNGRSLQAVYEPGTNYRVFRSEGLTAWGPLTNVSSRVIDGKILFDDLEPPLSNAFYKIEITRPR
jgi:subtilisin family serine protease